jgi:hypothetical protein
VVVPLHFPQHGKGFILGMSAENATRERCGEFRRYMRQKVLAINVAIFKIE